MQRWKAFNDFTQCKNVNLEGDYAKTCLPEVWFFKKTNPKLLIIWYWIQISFREIHNNSTRLHYLCPSVHTCTDPRHEL